jgi:iron(III) transport system permease protein
MAFAAMSLVTLVVGFLVLYPLAMLLYGSLWTGRPGAPGVFSLQNYVDAYTDPDTLRLLLKTVLATVMALTLAFIVTRTDTPLRGLLEVLIVTPFFVPPILEAIGWIMLLSPRTGTINVAFSRLLGSGAPRFSIYSLGGLLWVLSLGSTAFIFLLLVSALRNVDGSLEEAARVAGASPLRVATRVTLPVIAPAILGISLLSFIRALEAFKLFGMEFI